MKSTLRTLLALVAIAISCTSTLQAAEDKASALVSELYKAGSGKNSLFGPKTTQARLGHFFTKELAALIVKDGEESRRKNEVGVLDFDPLYGAQDLEIKNLVVNKAVTARGKATVLVSFTNYREKKTARLDLVEEDGAWKISDIHYADGSSLLKLFKAAAKGR